MPDHDHDGAAPDPGPDLLAIGAVAERSGLAPSAIRFYEARGLLRSSRSTGGQRRFERDVLRRLAFVRAAQAVGLGLDEVAEALASLPEDRTPTPEDWAALAEGWRTRLDEQLRLVRALRDQLDSCIGCGCLSFDRCALHNPGDVAATRGSGPRWLLGDVPPA